jgi:hypothetical protein
MRQHRAHVSFITGLIYYCTRLGLSSTASVIVSHSCTSFPFDELSYYIYRSSLRAASFRTYPIIAACIATPMYYLV